MDSIDNSSEMSGDPASRRPAPWSVKGVSPTARETAKRAAIATGMTIGAWLTQAIRDADNADRAGGDGFAEPAAPAPEPSDTAVRDAVRDRVAAAEARIQGVIDPLQETVHLIAARLAALERPDGGAAAGGTARSPEDGGPGADPPPGETPRPARPAQPDAG